jgi:hypothetical protein
MTERKTESLTLRLPERLQAEIERIAQRRGASASEVAREMLEHGARVERQIEAQELQRRYEFGPFDRADGTIEVQARFRQYTRLEREQEHWGQEDWEHWEEQEEARRRGEVQP